MHLRHTSELRARLLAWYDAQARSLPWRVRPTDLAAGVLPDPYRIWLSEVMLQQTTVAHATPYFHAFTERWPTVGDLAASPDEAVMSAWAGLGYYARARNLLACARAVAHQHGGVFPGSLEGLSALPGLGPYTAAAVGAIAFDLATNVVDGNVERVISRLFAVETPLPHSKPELKRLAGELVAAHRPGDWAQALMDLGATVCRPRTPECAICPVADLCAGLKTGAPQTYPRKRAKAERPRRHGVAYLLVCDGEVARVTRPGKGLLGGMLALPTSNWRAEPFSFDDAVAAAPVEAAWRSAGAVEHVFTHFALSLWVMRAETLVKPAELSWTPLSTAGAGLPSVFAKALKAGLSSLI
jgi:A/G-specific adenine glycosylase